MSSIVPRSGGGGLTRGGGRADETKTISYEVAGAVGWDRMPKKVRSDVAHEVARLVRASGNGPISSGLAATNPLCSGTGDTTTRRRPDGSCYQRRQGWWCGSGLLVEVEVRRPLAARPDGRYEAAGEWREERVEWHRLTDTTTKARRYEAGGEGGGGQAGRTDDPLEAIPPSAAATVRQGLRGSDCWLTTNRRTGWVDETVVGYAVVGDKLTVLRAERNAASRVALGSAAWRATVTRAALAPVAPGEPVKPALGTSPAKPLLGRARRALGR